MSQSLDPSVGPSYPAASGGPQRSLSPELPPPPAGTPEPNCPGPVAEEQPGKGVADWKNLIRLSVRLQVVFLKLGPYSFANGKKMAASCPPRIYNDLKS